MPAEPGRSILWGMIETERLRLRPYTLADFAPYCAMWSDMDLMRHIGGVAPSPEDAWNRILRYEGHWSLLGYGIFAVIEKASGRYVGETGLADFHRGLGDDFDKAGEAAWIFSSEVHGRGYAFEAACAAHDWYARRKGAGRTVCLIDPANDPSLRLAARLGYAPFREAVYKGRTAVMLEKSSA
ncbi:MULTISPECIES: GNAT family N-acetyltransferase [Sphingobium]|nr:MULTISPECIES: GNAT family N-acetyltransferase [Sphingobium]WDA36920.1 GNAT family N-acetyltransferase [Sphingobium sp. YC-XJ3]